jgi:hypothetical protein
VLSLNDKPKPTPISLIPFSGNVISIVDLNLGNRSLTNDIESVLRKIEHYQQSTRNGQNAELGIYQSSGTRALPAPRHFSTIAF